MIIPSCERGPNQTTSENGQSSEGTFFKRNAGQRRTQERERGACLRHRVYRVFRPVINTGGLTDTKTTGVIPWVHPFLSLSPVGQRPQRRSLRSMAGPLQCRGSKATTQLVARWYPLCVGHEEPTPPSKEWNMISWLACYHSSLL